MKLVYRPIGIVLGLLGGLIAKAVFNKLWSAFDDQEPPQATHEDESWSRILTVSAIQGAVFQVVRSLINRGGANTWAYLTGTWPGARRADPE